MATRDPEDKRRRLIESGLAEFAEHGLAGARLDRIAKGAGVSAGLLYSFFASKEALFDAVFGMILDRVVNEIPIDAYDLPGYAVRLRQARRENPIIARFITWYELERAEVEGAPEFAEANTNKIAQIEAAQAAGAVSPNMYAPQILATVIAIANDYRGPKDSEDDAIRYAVWRVIDPTRA